MDFLKIYTKTAKNSSQNRAAGSIHVNADFLVRGCNDLMARGKSFYSVFDEDTGLWSRNEYDVVRLVDRAIMEKVKELEEEGHEVSYSLMQSYESGLWTKYSTYIKSLPDSWQPLDNTIYFQNDPTGRSSCATRKLPYPLLDTPTECYDRLMSVLYQPEERDKLEWAVGAVLTGASKHIQKFITLYGSSGTGKSTFLNILQKLVEGYYISFNAKDLVGRDAFGVEVFKNNPLVAIQHDGDLSRIEDNSVLNSIISHEEVVINEKHKAKYSMVLNCFLFLGTNKPVMISDSKSGLIRRLIDVVPSGNKVSAAEYIQLIQGINFELGGIAKHCINKFKSMGEDYYNAYQPKEMMYETNTLFNFVSDYSLIFSKEPHFQLKQLYDMYREYCTETGEPYVMKRRQFRADMMTYFYTFHETYRLPDGKQVRSLYKGFKDHIFTGEKEEGPAKKEDVSDWLHLGENESLFDIEYGGYPAQYASDLGIPQRSWDDCDTILGDIDTSKLHYVGGLGEKHIVVDFDLKDETGQKSLELNLKAANKWPRTYAELSKSGQGIHLHYIWTPGNAKDLERLYSEGIEIKTFHGKSSLRRKLTLCNQEDIAELSCNLKYKEKKGGDMVDKKVIEDERHLRTMLKKCMRKEHHGATKPEVDFMYKLLEDSYSSGMRYDVSDMLSAITAFAASSSHQSEYCLDLVSKMKLKSEEKDISNNVSADIDMDDDSDIVFYDVEVYPNLFLIVYKQRGVKHKCVRLYNPTPQEVSNLFDMKLVGFNNKRYDDHMLYARYLGYSNEQLFELSKKIISKEGSVKNGFREAYRIAYTDIYDFSSKKQGLKKWQIELDLKHDEFEHPWDEPLDEKYWGRAGDYCENDVISSEAVFEHLEADWTARKILADISGLTRNHTTNQLTTQIVFRGDRNPQLEYTNLEDIFPGYSYVRGDDNKYRNMYRGVDLGKGGYVYAEPGLHRNVAVLDIESMHPTSIGELNLFGKYTQNYMDLKEARVAIKHGELDKVREMFGGKLVKYLNHPEQAEQLSYALKIAINSAYGLTSASFPNAMRDPRNVNNIVALRGALFMKTLQDEVQARGYRVVHIKTDSIKIPDADQSIIDFCSDFAKQYGYKFAHEATYEKMCLVNDAVFIAKYAWSEKPKNIGKWSPTGAQFAEPYVFKKLFSKEQITFKDLKQTKSVSFPASMSIDFNEGLEEGEHNYKFVGRVGSFVPVIPGTGGGELVRVTEDSKSAVVGTKGYSWKESDVVKDLELEDTIDLAYYDDLVVSAIKTIEKFAPISELVA